MRKMNDRGLTLIELLMAVAIFGFMAAGATALLSVSLGANTQGDSRYGLYREGLMIMERLTNGVRTCTHLFIPNAYAKTRNILAFSGLVNEDNDFYFDDPLFPRVDEDPSSKMTSGDGFGILGYDDDGDGFVDEDLAANDDEDTPKNEEILNGLDEDGDTNIDEDLASDANGDAYPGIALMDDDGDDDVDEMQNSSYKDDDDEDGSNNEDLYNPVIYSLVDGTSTFQVEEVYSGQTKVLSTRVSAFQATWETPYRILITLTLTGDDGEGVTFSEYVHIENTYQRIGKRVK
jgi:prepilin-type N-terminal cleavage/methylation domain-containing protein